jgi:hypothetical protein
MDNENKLNATQPNSSKMEELEGILIQSIINNLSTEAGYDKAQIVFDMLIRLLEAKATLITVYSQM